METDREILCWFHQRIVHQYGENEHNFMHRLRWIIQSTPKNKTSRGQKVKATNNSAKELLQILPQPSQFEKNLLSEI